MTSRYDAEGVPTMTDRNDYQDLPVPAGRAVTASPGSG